MATSFRTPFTVIQRNLGSIVNGKYILDDDLGTEITVLATVQVPSIRDLEKIQATEYGRRAARFIKIYTDTRLRCVNQAIAPGRQERYAGDLFLFDNSEYLLFGESNFTMLARTRDTQVSHWRYYACEIIEDAYMDMAP